MSRELIARNDDLRQLKESGHSLRVIDGFLVVDDIPYIDSNGVLGDAALLMQLELSANQTVQPSDHVAYWTGSFPYTTIGTKLEVLGESPTPPVTTRRNDAYIHVLCKAGGR